MSYEYLFIFCRLFMQTSSLLFLLFCCFSLRTSMFNQSYTWLHVVTRLWCSFFILYEVGNPVVSSLYLLRRTRSVSSRRIRPELAENLQSNASHNDRRNASLHGHNDKNKLRKYKGRLYSSNEDQGMVKNCQVPCHVPVCTCCS